MSNKLLMLAAVLLGAIAVIAVNLHVRRLTADSIPTETVLQVTGPISAGSTIGNNVDLVDIAAKETGLLADLVRYDQYEEIKDQVVVRTLGRGEYVRWSDFMWATRPENLALVDDEHFAVAIRSNPLGAFGGLILPGDAVDVYIPVSYLDGGATGLARNEELDAQGDPANHDEELRRSWRSAAAHPLRVLDNVTVLAVGLSTTADLAPFGQPRGRADFGMVTLAVRKDQLQDALRLAMGGADNIILTLAEHRGE